MRQEYEASGLDEDDLADEPMALFADWLAAATDAGLPEPNAMVVATVDGDGQPWTRTVLLKGVTAGRFEFYTNYESAKSSHLDANPAVALTFLWIPLRRQVSVTGAAVRVSPAESDRYWAVRPRGSQLGGWASAQSRPLASRQELLDAYSDHDARFAGAETVPRPDHWGGWAVTPRAIEFWQGRPNRLHDRFRYALDPAGIWSRTRLAP